MRTHEQLIADARLPAPIADAIRRVVSRSRLRGDERAEVARELCAHFSDGLSSGQSADELLRAFGSPDQAAKLIRAAVRRKRPASQRILSAALSGVAALFALLALSYLILFIRFRGAEPTIARNYAREINTRIEAAAHTDRAWPLYERAFSAWNAMPDRKAARTFPPSTPSDPIWPASLEYVRLNTENLELVREAARKPALGLALDFKPNPILRQFSESQGAASTPEAIPASSVDENPPLLEVRLPHLGPMRELARTLAFDLSLAAEENQPARARDDALALLGMANQLREHRFLICDLVSLAILSLATERVQDVIASKPELFTNDQLHTLAHAFAAFPTDQGPLVRFDGERAFFEDTLQRMFTDDGSGSGRLSPKGFQTYEQLMNSAPAGRPPELAEQLIGPLMSVALAPRAAQSRAYQALIAFAESQAATPPWQRTRSLDDEEDQILGQSKLAELRYLPVRLLTPAFNKVLSSSSILTQTRDALLVAIALELHRRQHHSYPASLDQLVPSLLPSIPRDMYDGGPIKYLLNDSKPLLYSVGVDRTDNHAAPPPKDTSPSRARDWMTPDHYAAWLTNFEATPPQRRSADVRGDWILYPRPEPTAEPH